MRTFDLAARAGLLAFLALGAAQAASAAGGGDFPFRIDCTSDEVDLRSFSVGRSDASPTGMMLWFQTRLGRQNEMPIQAEKLDGVWQIRGTVLESFGRQRNFRANVPADCQGHCPSRADMNVTEVGIGPDLGLIPSPARCLQKLQP
jgi:hypothetical protein